MIWRFYFCFFVLGWLLVSCGGGSDVGNPGMVSDPFTPFAERFAPSGQCNEDTFTCPDGSILFRNPENDCFFDLCEEETALRFYFYDED